MELNNALERLLAERTKNIGKVTKLLTTATAGMATADIDWAPIFRDVYFALGYIAELRETDAGMKTLSDSAQQFMKGGASHG